MVNSGRSISSLVISSLESFIVSAIFLPIFFAVSSALESFTGVTSWVLYSQAFLAASSCLVVVVYISTTQKSSTIGGDYISIFGNANCGAVFLLLVYYLVFFLNSVPYRGLIDNTKVILPDGKYEVSERLDWIQTALGSSGWELRGSTLHVASVSNIPVIGQVYMGVSLSYIFISFLLSAYCAYSSTPDGYYTNLFMDTRSLTSTNIFLVFGMPQMVNIGFSGCIGPLELLNPSTYDSGSLYILSAIAFVFFGDYFIHLLISSASKKGKENKKTSSKTYILQSIILTFVALVPTGYVMFLSSNATIITTISSSIIAGLSVFSCWSNTTGNSSDKKKNHVEVATVVANNSRSDNSSIMPAIGLHPDLKISKDSTTKKIENSSSPSNVVEKEASIIEGKKEDDKSNTPTNIPNIQKQTTSNNNNRKEISFFTMSSSAANQTSSYQQRNFFGFNNNNNNGYQQLQRDNQQQQAAAASLQNNSKPRRYLA